MTDSRQLLTKAHEAETKGMAGTRAVRAGDLGSHAEVRQVEQSEVAGHQGEGRPSCSLPLLRDSSPGLQAQLRLFNCRAGLGLRALHLGCC